MDLKSTAYGYYLQKLQFVVMLVNSGDSNRVSHFVVYFHLLLPKINSVEDLT